MNAQKQRKEKNQSKLIEEVTKKYQQDKSVAPNKTMFTEQEINGYEEQRHNVEEEIELEEIPIRQAGGQTVKFTERIYRNLAARDQFYKEPPMPKNKDNNLSNGDMESKNPLWLKDKGDSFVKDKNYLSAIDAYSQALKLFSKFISALLN